MSSTQTIPEAPRTPTQSEVIRAALDSWARGLHVALPGRVESYDAAEQKADIKPMVKDLTPTRTGRELLEIIPVIPNVPIVFPRAGGYFLTMPVRAGDFVLLVVCERSIDVWISSDGGEKNPDDFRTHNLSDAVAIPGLYPFSQSIGESGIDVNGVLGREGGPTVHLKPDGSVHLSQENASDFVALSDLVKTEIEKVVAYVDSVKSVFAVGVPAAGDGGAAIQTSQITASQAISPPTIAAPAASKVKAT